MTPPKAKAKAGHMISAEEITRLVDGSHHNPHSILGAHVTGDYVTVRTLRPNAKSVDVVVGTDKVPMEHERAGVWVAVLERDTVPDYRLEVTYDETTFVTDDPYRWLPTLGEVDLHLISEGRHEQLWEVLGAHVRAYAGTSGTVTGTSFAVWAPSARGLRVAGDFNNWDSSAHPMRVLGSTGVWELFIPDVGAGTRYKFHVLGADGVWREKADPMAFAT